MPRLGSEVRASLAHPVIDADAHMSEFAPALERYLRQEGLPDLTAGFRGPHRHGFGNGHQPVAARKQWRETRSPWWGLPPDPYEFATSTLPRLLYERLDEFGIDFAVVYTSAGLGALHRDDERLRIGSCRALNHYNAESFDGLGDRMVSVGLVSAHTPDEAIRELEHAVVDLGFKTVLVPAYVRRPLPGAVAEAWPQRAVESAGWYDTFGIDSDYDYDPFWQRCSDLGVVVATHSIGLGLGFRRSISRFMYNDVGHFAATAEAVCKSLFMGGVTHRFPNLHFALLEGGVGWACSLYHDLFSRWEKRSGDAVFQYDPRRFDSDVFDALIARYGGSAITGSVKDEGPSVSAEVRVDTVDDDPRQWENFDEFGPAGIGCEADFRERFVDHFWFGCEADDRSVKAAFDTSVNPGGAALQALFSSDIGHWDVPDASRVVGEAYEQVEHGWLDHAQFREFVFANAARLWGEAFFEGTVVHDAVRAELAPVPAR